MSQNSDDSDSTTGQKPVTSPRPPGDHAPLGAFHSDSRVVSKRQSLGFNFSIGPRLTVPKLRQRIQRNRSGMMVNKPRPVNDEDSGDEQLMETGIIQANSSERVILNVGGQIHETYLATLNRIPETRLARVAQDYDRDPSYDPESGTFFFNRNPVIFVYILQYYRTGELHIDHEICGNAIKNEFDFWQIDPNDIEPCCWAPYARFLQNKETLKMLDDSFAVYEDLFAEPEGEKGWRRLQRRLWRLIEDPSFSIVGKVFATLSIFFVVISVCAYVLETHTFFRVPRPESFLNESATELTQLANISQTLSNSSSLIDRIWKNVELEIFELTESNSTVVWWLSIVTFVSFGWFTFEYLVRLAVCPNKKEFFRSMLNNLDLLVLLAMAFETMAAGLDNVIPRSRYLRILIPLRFARIIRIMKLMKHYRAFKVLVYTLKVSLKELWLMIIFLMIGVIIFACLVYYVEPETFDNIPIACWWALITMTTVGYGDYHPKRVGGYVIGAVAAIFGVLMIAFTVPIVVNNFSLYYSHAQTRATMRPKRRATKLLNKLAALTMFVPTLQEIQEALDEEKARIRAERGSIASSTSSAMSVDSGMDDKKGGKGKKKKKDKKKEGEKDKKKEGEKDKKKDKEKEKENSANKKSIKKSKVLSEEREKQKREISLAQLSEAPTLPSMAAWVSSDTKDSSRKSSVSEINPLAKRRASIIDPKQLEEFRRSRRLSSKVVEEPTEQPPVESHSPVEEEEEAA